MIGRGTLGRCQKRKKSWDEGERERGEEEVRKTQGIAGEEHQFPASRNIETEQQD
jgi:hypothetical protein